MKIQITEEAESDLADGFWFYESQTPDLGAYFRSCLISDIDSLAFYAGTHETCSIFIEHYPRDFPMQFTIKWKIKRRS
jgi:hypothetical protein